MQRALLYLSMKTNINVSIIILFLVVFATWEYTSSLFVHHYRFVLLHYVKFKYIIIVIVIFITIICTFNLHFVIRLKHISGRHGLLQLAQTTVDLVAELGAGVLLGTRPPPASRGGGGHALVQTVDSRPGQQALVYSM